LLLQYKRLGGIISFKELVYLKRFFVLLLASVLFLLCACVADDSPLEFFESSESGSESQEESIGSESENSSNDFFLDIAVDLLPLFDNPEKDPDYEDKINGFLNFIYDEYGENALRDIYLEMKSDGYSDEMWLKHTGSSIHVLRSLFTKEYESSNYRLISRAESKDEITVAFGGDVCFGDNYATMPYLQNRKNGILNKCISQEWIDFMNEVDIATVNNEFSISSRGEPMPRKKYTYVAKPEHTRYYNEMGIDFVTLANNHVFDYGEDAFFDTMSVLDEYGINYAGAGKNAEAAQKPFYYIINGRKLAFISATRAEKHILTPEATESAPGVFRCYDPERLLSVIEQADRESDFIILFVHWGEENSSRLESVLKKTSHQYIDAGADLIIGSHAHRLQGIEYYNGKAIFYNLGNFWFNAKEVETGQVKLILSNDLSTEYYFIPAMQAACKVSFELGTARGREILNNLQSLEPSQVVIEDDGRIIFENSEEE